MQYAIKLLVVLSVMTFGVMGASNLSAAQEKVDELRHQCDLGNATSCGMLGSSFEYGLFVPQNYVEAAKLYRKACRLGDQVYCNGLGELYRNGLGVQQDHWQASALFRSACELNDTYSCFNLGLQYASGQGVQKNIVVAYALFTITSYRGVIMAETAIRSIQPLMTPQALISAHNLSRHCFNNGLTECLP